MNPAGVSIMRIIYLVISGLQLIILADVIISWIPSLDRYHPLVIAIRRITRPIYRPIQRLIPPEKTGYVDVSPAIAILGLYIIGMILESILVR